MLLLADPPEGYAFPPYDRPWTTGELVVESTFVGVLLAVALTAGVVGTLGRMGARLIYDAQQRRSARDSRRGVPPSG